MYLRDRLAGNTTLISSGSYPTVSRSGRYVAYSGHGGIFVLDRETGLEERGDLAPGGDPANARSWAPVLSGDGRHLLFVSDATNLVTSRPNRYGWLYLRDLDAGTTVLVNAFDLNSPYSSGYLRDALGVSDDGGVVAYNTPSVNWVFQPAVWTRATGRTVRGPGVALYGGLSLSGDGRFLALAGGQDQTATGGVLLVMDLATSAVESAFVSSLGVRGEGRCMAPSLSRDGRHVAFASDASNLVPGDVHAPGQTIDVFVRDRVLGTTELASLSSTGEQLTGWELSSSLPVGGVCDDGRCACFVTRARAVAGDWNGANDVFVRTFGRAAEPAAPVADASGPYHGWSGRSVAFDASRSVSAASLPLAATWDFGDGSPRATAPAGDPAQHVYVAAGAYTATLTVSDGDRSSVPAQVRVEVLVAPAAGASALGLHPACGRSGAAVTVVLERRPLATGASWNEAAQGEPGSILDADPPAALELSLSGPSGDLGVTAAAVTGLSRTAPLEYSVLAGWQVPVAFGDGTYTVTAGGASAAFQVPCAIPAALANRPVSVPGGPYAGIAGTPVAFDGTGSTDLLGRPLTYAWDFGDGATAAGAQVQHTYAEPGTYRAVLSVENGEQASNCGITGDCAVFVTVAAPAGAPPTPPPVPAASAGGCGCGSAAPDAGLLAVVVALVARKRLRVCRSRRPRALGA